MFYPVVLFRAFCVVEPVESPDKVTCDAADSLELHALADKNMLIWHADTFQFLPPACEEVYLGVEIDPLGQLRFLFPVSTGEAGGHDSDIPALLTEARLSVISGHPDTGYCGTSRRPARRLSWSTRPWSGA